MGWSSGSDLMTTIVKAVKPHVRAKAARTKIYKPIYDALCEQDWDTQDEVIGLDPALDEILRRNCPSLFEQDDEWDGE